MKKTIDFNAVADLYDIYVQTDMDIGFYLELCSGRRNILELMCGTGRVSLPLVRKGFRLTCVDYSEAMLDVFRSKLAEGDKADIICQDICNLDLKEKYDIAFIPFNSIMEITGQVKRKQAFERIYAHLEPSGFFFCSLYNPDYRIKSADGSHRTLGRFEMDGGKILVVSFSNSFSEEEKVICGNQFYEIYDETNGLLERRVLDIRFSVITQDEILVMANSVGFELKEIYGDYEKHAFCLESPYMNFLFQK